MGSPFGMIVVHGLAVAAGPVPTDRPPEEIIVTGERVPRTVRRTSSSVVVVSERALEASATDRLDQLLEAVPNIQPGSGEEAPAIRGQDSTGVLRALFAFLGGSRPRVTLQVDGRPVTYYEYVSSSAPMWDVRRVELFRSPQTTTQGRNSIAGAIFVETNSPSFTPEGRARVILADHRTRHASAVLSGPLLADQLAIRVSGDIRRSRMASAMADGIVGADIDRDDYWQVRIKGLLTPKDLPGLRLETSYVHTRTQAPQFEAVRAPFRERRTTVPERTNGIYKVRVDSLTARLSYPVTPVLSSTLTLSAGDALVRRFGLPGLGRTRVDARDRSVEAIVRWEPGATLSLVGGSHWLANRQGQYIDIRGLGIGEGGFRDRQWSLGLFGEASWQPTEPLRITAGLRRQIDRQRRTGQVGPPRGGIATDYDERFGAWLPKLALSYDLSAATSIGAMVQRAYNPGGTSISLARRLSDSFGEEGLWNGELFLRSRVDGGRGTLAVNGFVNAIRDSQRQLTVPIPLPDGSQLFATEYANAPRARAYGLEASLDWKVTSQLGVRGGLGLLETRLVETITPNDPTRGKAFQRSPRMSAVAAIDWQALPPLRLSGQVRYHTRYFSDDANSAALAIPKATIVDVRGEWRHGRTTLFGYARNLLDKFTMSYLFTPTFGAAGDPREVGVGLERGF